MSEPKATPTCTVYLMRHGDSRADGEHRLIGQTDCPLNAVGREQVERWRRHFSQTAFTRVICSDLTRSVQTAQAVASGSPAPVEQLGALREIDLGEWDGLSAEEVKRRWPAQYAERGLDIAHYRPPGGESFADLAARVLPAFRSLVAESHGDVLVVGHAGVNRVILCDLLGMALSSLFRLGQEYGCLSVVEFSADTVVVRELRRVPVAGVAPCDG